MKFRTPWTFRNINILDASSPGNTYIMTGPGARPQYKSRSCYSRERKAGRCSGGLPDANAISLRGRGLDNGVASRRSAYRRVRMVSRRTKLPKCSENRSGVLGIDPLEAAVSRQGDVMSAQHHLYAQSFRWFLLSSRVPYYLRAPSLAVDLL